MSNEGFVDLYDVGLSMYSSEFNGIGRANVVENEDDRITYFIVSSNPEDESDEIDLNNLDSFTIGYNRPEYFRKLATHEITHEITHTFFHGVFKGNPKYSELIEDTEYLFTDSLSKDMQKLAALSALTAGWSYGFGRFRLG